MKAPLYNQKGEKTGEVALNSKIFESEINEGLIHQALILQEANARHPIAHTLTKGEVRGGGRKPYRQKGTGNARQGSIRNPHYKGGGVAFGPRSNRNFTLRMPQSQRRKALFSALSSKAKSNQILILESYDGKTIKTKLFAEMMKKLPLKRNALVVIGSKNEVIQKSSHNLPHSKTILGNYLNVKDLLTYESIIFLKSALETVEKTFVKSRVK